MKAKYIGNGSHLLGIPARDLSEDDWKVLTDSQKKAVKESGLYELNEKQVKESVKE